MKPGGWARFRKRRLRCGYITARRRLARRAMRARFTSACASRASEVFKRSEDTDVAEGANEWPVSDLRDRLSCFLQNKENKVVRCWVRSAGATNSMIARAGVLQSVAQFSAGGASNGLIRVFRRRRHTCIITQYGVPVAREDSAFSRWMLDGEWESVGT